MSVSPCLHAGSPLSGVDRRNRWGRPGWLRAGALTEDKYNSNESRRTLRHLAVPYDIRSVPEKSLV